jgi:hypothetical protein
MHDSTHTSQVHADGRVALWLTGLAFTAIHVALSQFQMTLGHVRASTRAIQRRLRGRFYGVSTGYEVILLTSEGTKVRCKATILDRQLVDQL